MPTAEARRKHFAIVAGVAAVAVAALASPQATLEGMQPPFAGDGSPIAGIAAIFAVAPWAFVGFDTVPQAAEEYNFAPRRAKALMVVSIVFGALVYIVLVMLISLGIKLMERRLAKSDRRH